ncbi:MAG: hypothetical protein WC568_11510 [Candidatus Methanoperedens sp.]
MAGICKDGCSGLCAWEYGGIAGEDSGIGVDAGVDAGVLTQPEIINNNTIEANVTMWSFFPMSINRLQGVTYPR